MTARRYHSKTERVEGQPRSVVRVHCRGCGVSHGMPMTGFRALPDAVIERKLTAIGWTIGANPNWDFCPACTNKQKEKPALKIVSTDSAAPCASASPSEDLPRQMQREDRRIIFEKLNEVYLDEKRGYDSGWSDHRVASDLGVPRAWVQTVRQENFGDNGGNEEAAQFLAQVESMLAEARTVLNEARTHRERIEELYKSTSSISGIDGIKDRLNKIERLAVNVRKLTGQ